MKTVEKYAKKDWDELVKRVVSAQSSLKDIILILNLINKVLISFKRILILYIMMRI